MEIFCKECGAAIFEDFTSNILYNTPCGPLCRDCYIVEKKIKEDFLSLNSNNFLSDFLPGIVKHGFWLNNFKKIDRAQVELFEKALKQRAFEGYGFILREYTLVRDYEKLLRGVT